MSNGTAKTLERMAEEATATAWTAFTVLSIRMDAASWAKDHKNTQKLLASMVRHPNAGAVLVLSLGCENNNVNEI